ncbi:MAG: DUF1801 domain-containing protein [Reyranella sp.]|uniref:DUF1801 domain-containing protein n=1 Tax=Reyranella sp. TaxID=1929291 RepID=UPI002731FE98|nr:DUF1801 domain-containing protein [Reyranella sp.]MDP1964159.1 DUF1801 domain-containing protein [Reyranella sp.]MDP2374984.1 DUF1801 domain-containing protein [Reyranella sp.]
MRRFGDAKVAAVFKAYPPAVRTRLLALRELVFDVAAATPGVGRLAETLKWGQASYLTAESGSGTTVRIDRPKGRDDGYAVYFHCQSGLVETFRTIYPETFTYEGKRALLFGTKGRAPVRALRHCLALALTHHVRKKSGRAT